LDEKFYKELVQPRLLAVPVPKIMARLSVSEPYALGIRAGRRVPHPRHWLALARLAGVSRHAGVSDLAESNGCSPFAFIDVAFR